MKPGSSELREYFPAIGDGLVYLDNAASTLKPRQVVDAMSVFALERYANVHRGVYRLAAEATRAYDEAHSIVARFIGASPREVVFTSGTTSSIHLAVQLLLHNNIVSKGSRIIVPEDAHHSLLLPLARLARYTGSSLTIVPVNDEGLPEWHRLDEFLDADVSLVAVSHVSNVTGYESPVREIARKAKRYGALVLVDGAQGVPHIPVDVSDLGVDLLAFSGHKMLGPTGIGVLWIRGSLAEEWEPPYGGGGTVRDVSISGNRVEVEWEPSPLRFEAGTPPIIEAVGLSEAVRLLSRIGMESVAFYEARLTRVLFEELSSLEGVRIVGPADTRLRRGIVSFGVGSVDPDLIAVLLGQKGVAVRSGHHCAIPLHKRLGLVRGTVRASLYVYNNENDISIFIETLKSIINKL